MEVEPCFHHLQDGAILDGADGLVPVLSDPVCCWVATGMFSLILPTVYKEAQ